MQFNDNVVTEITAPNNVPFEPGFNIIGIGTEIPPELAALGIEAAIIFYSDGWDPTLTVPRIKFFYIATISNTVVFGFAHSDNPSTTPAVVNHIQRLQLSNVSGTGFASVLFRSISTPDRSFFSLTESPLGANLSIADANGDTVWVQQGSTRGQNWVIFDPILGEIQFFYTSDTQLLGFGPVNNLGYGQWVDVTYQNGWAAVGAPTFGRSGIGFLRLPDGTIHMTGVAQGGTLAVGTVIGNIPANYRPRFSKKIMVTNGNAAGFIHIVCSGVTGNITIVGPFAAAAGETAFESSWTTQG